jgi:hypothetical protein
MLKENLKPNLPAHVKCAIVEVVPAVAAAIVLLVEAIVLQWLLRLLLLFVAGKLDDVATIRSGSLFGILVGYFLRNLTFLGNLSRI